MHHHLTECKDSYVNRFESYDSVRRFVNVIPSYRVRGFNYCTAQPNGILYIIQSSV